MEDDFRNLTAKVWANLDNPIKIYDFSKVLLIFVYVALSGGTLLISVISQQNNCLMELYTNCYKILLFMKINFPSSFIPRYVIGLRWMCMYLWMNLIKRTIDIQEKLEIVKIYINVQSQWRVVLLWYHILSKSAQTFTVGFVKLLSTHPIHIVVWGNFLFNISIRHQVLRKTKSDWFEIWARDVW